MNEKRSVLPRTFQADVVQKDYSRVAWFYDFWSWLTESKAAKQGLLMAQIENGETILEVAVGTGLVFEEIIKRNKTGMNVGIELSPSMLLKALRRIEKTSSGSFYLQYGNALRLPFKSDHFDLIINNYMLDLLPQQDFEPVLSEFKRVLKPSGRIVISTMAHGEKWFNEFWTRIAARFPGALTGCRPVSMRSYLEAAGFLNIEVSNLSQNTFPSEVLRASLQESR